MLDWFLLTISSYSHTISLEIMALVGGFIEEIAPPMPVPPIMFIVGSFARVQEYPLLAILGLAMLSALGRTLGGTIVYKVVDKAEDVFINRFGRYFGLKVGQIESFGQRFSRNWSDYLLLIAIRSLPFISSTLVSVASGLIKIPLRVFWIATYVGSVMRDSFFLYAGFIGTRAFKHFLQESAHISIVIKLSVIVSILGLLIYLYARQQSKKKQNGV
jgi:membrane protein DedA with SNARE-associated domain